MSDTPQITIADILEAVAAHYGLTPAAIRSSRRDGLVSRARHIVCWLAGLHTEATNMAIGRALHCDHTVAIRGRREIQELRAHDPAIGELLDGLAAAAIAVATLRARMVLPPPRHIDAFEAARRIVDGGNRAAGMASVAEIMAICETLESFADEQDDHRRRERLRGASAEVVEARAAVEKATYTAGERQARARLERALNALSNELAQQKLEHAHV